MSKDDRPVPLPELPVGVVTAIIETFAAEIATVKPIADMPTYVSQLRAQILDRAGQSLWAAKQTEKKA